jgi:transcriptional regulator with XRE-family HTH domain
MVELTLTSREWSDRIRRLLKELKLTQPGLAERLGVSPATVSRWLAGKNEPTAETYVALGNLAGRPDGAYFWERAGIDTSELPDPSLRQTLSSIQATLEDFKLITNRKVSRHLAGRGNAVAISLLNACYDSQDPIFWFQQTSSISLSMSATPPSGRSLAKSSGGCQKTYSRIYDVVIRHMLPGRPGLFGAQGVDWIHRGSSMRGQETCRK